MLSAANCMLSTNTDGSCSILKTTCELTLAYIRSVFAACRLKRERIPLLSFSLLNSLMA